MAAKILNAVWQDLAMAKWPFFLIFFVALFFTQLSLVARESERGNETITLIGERLEGHYAPDIRAISKPIVYENGILFTFSAGKTNDDVCISGDFFHWNKRLKMSINQHGIFYCFIKLEIPAATYKYRYFVNGFWLNDPEQTMVVVDEYGDKITAFKLPKDLIDFEKSPKLLATGKYLFFLKDKNYQSVSWVGSKNSWDPFVTPMKLENGYWQIVLSLKPTELFYLYCLNGNNKILDPANHSTASLKFGEKVSLINSSKISE
jgi:hypothetical protein